MKTSNKLLLGTGICIVLGIITHTFIMRGTYQNALKNPLSNKVNIGLKAVKYMNIEYRKDITFKHGDKFEIVVDRMYKDSLKINYKNNSLNLDISKVNEVTIILPTLPEMNFVEIKAPLEKKEVEVYGDNEDYRTIDVDSTFRKGNFVATFQKNANLYFRKCSFDKIDVKGKENLLVQIEKCEVAQLNLNLIKFSSLVINNSNIQAKNVVLGDSCNISISGKAAKATFLK